MAGEVTTPAAPVPAQPPLLQEGNAPTFQTDNFMPRRVSFIRVSLEVSNYDRVYKDMKTDYFEVLYRARIINVLHIDTRLPMYSVCWL